MLRATIALLMCVLLSSAAMAQKRVALVIGNSAYQRTPKLTNPRNDATDMAAVLKKHGFQVVEGFDLDKASFDRKVRDFADTMCWRQGRCVLLRGPWLAGRRPQLPRVPSMPNSQRRRRSIGRWCARTWCSARWSARQRPTSSSWMHACTIRSPATPPWARSAQLVGRGLVAEASGSASRRSWNCARRGPIRLRVPWQTAAHAVRSGA